MNSKTLLKHLNRSGISNSDWQDFQTPKVELESMPDFITRYFGPGYSFSGRLEYDTYYVVFWSDYPDYPADAVLTGDNDTLAIYKVEG